MGKPKPKKKQKAAAPTPIEIKAREVLYPEIITNIGQGPLVLEKSKELLGYTESEEEAKKFGCNEPLFIDREGKKIYAVNNIRNRPFYIQVAENLVQEHLNKRWRYNGEPIIIGETGLVLNGQHTLVSHILAEQDRVGKQSMHWASMHDGPITVDKLVILGVKELDEIINTMDTCKPRSISDVIWRSPYFQEMNPTDRRKASRLCDHAIRLLWSRTGVVLDAFASRRTHTEALDFINRHSRLLEAVKEIMENNTKDQIGQFITPGYASALLYLMAISESDPDEYRNADPPSEAVLNFDRWDKALEFWVLFASGSSTMQEMRHALGALVTESGEKPPIAQKSAVVCKAWNYWIEGHKLKQAELEPAFNTDGLGIRKLAEVPTVGGIDLGNPRAKDGGSDDSEAPTDPTATADDEAPALTEPKTESRVIPTRAGGLPLNTSVASRAGKVADVMEHIAKKRKKAKEEGAAAAPAEANGKKPAPKAPKPKKKEGPRMKVSPAKMKNELPAPGEA